MGFGVDYNQAPQTKLIPEGEYEVVIKSAYEDISNGGTVFFNVPLIVRNDVEQPYQDAYIWHKLWKKKDPTPEDLACDGYSYKQIQGLSKAAELPNGKNYATLTEWGEDLKGLPIRVVVEHDTYNGKTNARVKYLNETNHAPCNHVYKNTESQANNYAAADPLSNDELPF